VVCKTNCIKQPRGICPVHLTQPQYTDNPQNIHVCEEVLPGHHNVLRVGSQYVVVVR